jgi:nucleotide-binding universal stress UspA family protein
MGSPTRKAIARIAVAYDDSAGARAALAQAVALLRLLPDAKLTVIAIDEPNADVDADTSTADTNAGSPAVLSSVPGMAITPGTPGTPSPSRPRTLTHSRDWIKAASEYAQQHGTQLTADVRTGHAAGQILIAARAARADLLVIGHGRHPELHNRVLGSTAEHVARHAFCSVLIAH